MSTEEREKASILLVDDQPSRLTTYEAILGDLGHELVRASSGRQALEHIQRTQFAVIVLDVNMPVLDGFETAALIQRHPSSEPTPIIFVTGLRIADFDRLRGYELGAVDYVYVPVVPEILRAKVAVFVELSTNRRRLRTLIERLEAANAELALANSALECETARELKEKNEALERANAELTRTNSDLAAEVVERARLAADLNEADRRKDEFLSILAHELRNPLAPIVSAVEIMRRTKIEDPELVWCREVVDRQSRNLTRLVEGLLDVSRITTGKIQIQKAEIEIAAVVERAIELARPQVDAGRHRLTVERPGHPIHVEGDLTRLAQAVGNVLGNAAKYTPEGGQIRVIVEESRRPDDTPEVAIRVRDTGVGIEPEALPYVFELFTQGERALDRAHGALGIGLALVARLVEIHGGTVAAHSDGPGAGSEFVIRLPALSRREAGGERQPAARGRPPSHSAQRVLVVDDNADAARSLAVLLEAAGNTVEIAFDGTEAIDMADEFRPDAVLLDIGMPRLDGYGAARWIRAQPWARNVLLVAVTGWGQEDVRARTLEAGFDEHMVKPVDVASLAQLFAKLPSGHRCDLVDT